MLKVGLSKNELIGQTINGRFLIRKHLGGGSFGDVFEAEDNEQQIICAIKFETGNATNPQLNNEYKCYKTLDGCPNVPKTFGIFDFNKNRVFVMEKMGPSLETLFKRCGKKFSLKTTLMIADQLLRGIEYIHNSGLLHRDIKPQNFVVGRGQNSTRIYFIDFGVSTNYIDPRTRDHVMYTPNNGLIGTAYYVSIHTHLGDQQSRRDDLESIFYVLVRFLKGTLPWQITKIKNKVERNEKLAQMKIQTTIESLCKGLPSEFTTYIEYVRSLRYDETPKYAELRWLFNNLFLKKGLTYDLVYDWDDEATIHRPLPSVYLYHTANKFLRVNERQIKPKKEHVSIPQHRNIFLNNWRK